MTWLLFLKQSYRPGQTIVRGVLRKKSKNVLIQESLLVSHSKQNWRKTEILLNPDLLT